MFSHLVTAAREFLARPDSSAGAEPASDHIVQDGQEARESQISMVTSTRRSGRESTEADNPESLANRGSPAVNGKRKGVSTTSKVTDGQPQKRQKKPGPTVNGSGPAKSSDSSTSGRRGQAINSVEISEKGSETSGRRGRSTKSTQNDSSANTGGLGLPKKPTHVRFGSEEPAPPVEDEDDADQPNQNNDERGSDQEESDDDEAPEAVSNVALREELKDVDRKRDHVRQQDEQRKRDKRREHEKRLQSQAAFKASAMSPLVTQKSTHDDLLSESSATLQGSDGRPTGPSAIQSLPALLPEEILNAEPSVRPPTPPRETNEPTINKKPTKIRFLDPAPKTPKDVKVGATSIRVLDGTSHPNSKAGSNPSLAPKSSKASKNVRDRWVSGSQNKDVSSGLRRTTGKPSGFVTK